MIVEIMLSFIFTEPSSCSLHLFLLITNMAYNMMKFITNSAQVWKTLHAEAAAARHPEAEIARCREWAANRPSGVLVARFAVVLRLSSRAVWTTNLGFISGTL
jgi:hypothetical protein